ncbi:hypothetical protein J6590_104995 [Homalodisca vitripennis]|nr:hypothetical protein J6590_104995 [Homalodisca vitripennis]
MERTSWTLADITNSNYFFKIQIASYCHNTNTDNSYWQNGSDQAKRYAKPVQAGTIDNIHPL